jgi:hypothetical protein
MQGVSDAMATVSRWLVRAVVLAAGLVFGLSLLVAGLVLALVVTVWSLLRGRRPTVVQFRRFSARSWTTGFGGMPPGFGATPRQRGGEVIDIEAREVGAPRAPEGPPPAVPRD